MSVPSIIVSAIAQILRNAMLKRYGDAPWTEDRVADAVLGAVEALNQWKPVNSSAPHWYQQLLYGLTRGWIAAQRAAVAEAEETEKVSVSSDLPLSDEEALDVFFSIETQPIGSEAEASAYPSAWDEWMSNAILIDDEPDPGYRALDVPSEEDEMEYETLTVSYNIADPHNRSRKIELVKPLMARVSVPDTVSEPVPDTHGERELNFPAYEPVNPWKVMATHERASSRVAVSTLSNEGEISWDAVAPLFEDPRVIDEADEDALARAITLRTGVKFDLNPPDPEIPDSMPERFIPRIKARMDKDIREKKLWPSQAVRLLALLEGLSPREAASLEKAVYNRSRRVKSVLGLKSLPYWAEMLIAAKEWPGIVDVTVKKASIDASGKGHLTFSNGKVIDTDPKIVWAVADEIAMPARWAYSKRAIALSQALGKVVA